MIRQSIDAAFHDVETMFSKAKDHSGKAVDIWNAPRLLGNSNAHGARMGLTKDKWHELRPHLLSKKHVSDLFATYSRSWFLSFRVFQTLCTDSTC